MSLTKPGKIIIGFLGTMLIGGIVYVQSFLYQQVQVLKQEAKVKAVITRMITPTITASPSATLTPKKEIGKNAEIVPTKVIPTKAK